MSDVEQENDGSISDLLRGRLRGTLHRSTTALVGIWGGGTAVVIVGFVIAWFFMEPAPPEKFVIAAGPKDGAYYFFADQYRQHLAKHGIQVVVRETSGSSANYELLKNDPFVHVALVQGGSAPEDVRGATNIEALASVYLEPVWVFYRADERLHEVRELKSRRIAIGVNGSGTQFMANMLLRENGISRDNATLLAMGGRDAAQMLFDGDIDALILVTSPTSTLIRELFGYDEIKLMSLDRHAAYARRHAFLSDVTLRRGVIDLARDLPAEEVHLVAPAANLVATPEFHDALIPLMLSAASLAHEQGDTLSAAGRFPSTEFIEFPLNESARRYFESGPPVLQKYLPFWVASAIDRGIIFLLPGIALLLPLLRAGPPLYRWRIRSRIYKWYRILRSIEQEIRRDPSEEVFRTHLKTLDAMEAELDELKSVPLAYMEEFYNLRLHVEFVHRRVQREQDAREE